jgi:hypothetical protein
MNDQCSSKFLRLSYPLPKNCRMLCGCRVHSEVHKARIWDPPARRAHLTRSPTAEKRPAGARRGTREVAGSLVGLRAGRARGGRAGRRRGPAPMAALRSARRAVPGSRLCPGPGSRARVFPWRRPAPRPACAWLEAGRCGTPGAHPGRPPGLGAAGSVPDPPWFQAGGIPCKCSHSWEIYPLVFPSPFPALFFSFVSFFFLNFILSGDSSFFA